MCKKIIAGISLSACFLGMIFAMEDHQQQTEFSSALDVQIAATRDEVLDMNELSMSARKQPAVSFLQNQQHVGLSKSLDEAGTVTLNPKRPLSSDATDEIVNMNATSVPVYNNRNVSPIDLSYLVQSPRVSSNGEKKRRVESVKNLKRVVSAAADSGHVTMRSKEQKVNAPTRNRKFHLDDVDKPAENMPFVNADVSPDQRQTGSFLPAAIASKFIPQLPLDYSQAGIPEEKVWSMLERHAPGIYQFAKKHNYSFEELEKFNDLVDQLDIDPQVVTEFIHEGIDNEISPSFIQTLISFLPGISQNNDAHLNSQYEKIKNESPDKYKAILFELVKATVDNVDGQPTRSPLVDTHIALQNDRINVQKDTILTQLAGIIVGVIVLIPGWVTSITQFVQSSNSTL
jgi:hypothetical protein